MTLPLPFQVKDSDTQANFDEIAQQFPIDKTNLSAARRKSIITTTESRTNVAYGTLTTPDQVTGVVLPADGLLCIAFQGTWQESVSGAGRAAIFIGANQLKRAWLSATSPQAQEADLGGTAAQDAALVTTTAGLGSAAFTGTGYTGDVTTGQVIGSSNDSSDTATLWSGPIYIFAAAGTYTISVQFKSSSGSVTAKNRKLWVWTMEF